METWPLVFGGKQCIGSVEQGASIHVQYMYMYMYMENMCIAH